jgi:hypothetical protein
VVHFWHIYYNAPAYFTAALVTKEKVLKSCHLAKFKRVLDFNQSDVVGDGLVVVRILSRKLELLQQIL